jgi:TetR/AcrR family transcriptional repressor of nem operon
VARTLEFDYSTVLERATRVFWETGYAGTSLRDLLRQMEIGEGSTPSKAKRTLTWSV